jgi:uncharacterized protein (TIGR03382 family)
VWNGGVATNDAGPGGYSCGAVTTVVPEPGTVVLPAAGMMGLAVIVRRRRRLVESAQGSSGPRTCVTIRRVPPIVRLPTSTLPDEDP